MALLLMPDGSIVMPKGMPELAELASQMGDEDAAEELRQASMTKVLVGRRMCG